MCTGALAVFLVFALSGCGNNDTKTLTTSDCGDRFRFANGSCSVCPFDEFPVGGVINCVPCAANAFFNGTACHVCSPPLVASTQGCSSCPVDKVFSNGRCVSCDKIEGGCALKLRRSSADENAASNTTISASQYTLEVVSTTTTSLPSFTVGIAPVQTPEILQPGAAGQLNCSNTEIVFNGECTDCVKFGYIKTGDTCGSCDYRSVPYNGACVPCRDDELVMTDFTAGVLICANCPAG